MGFLIYIITIVSLGSFSQKNALADSSVKEINKTKKILNKNMDMFSNEFFNDNNLYEESMNITDNIQKKKDIKEKELSENLKVTEKETDEFIIRGLDIPNLSSRRTYVSVDGNDIIINYEKKDFIEISESFSKKKKFVKKIKLPANADPNTLKYRVLNNKLILTFRKKEKK